MVKPKTYIIFDLSKQKETMSRHLKFEVTVAFSGAITSDEDIMTIAENIAKAIRHRANEEGISPDESDFYAQMVHIKPQFVDDTVSLKI